SHLSGDHLNLHSFPTRRSSDLLPLNLPPKSMTAGNHSILALTKVRQPAAAHHIQAWAAVPGILLSPTTYLFCPERFWTQTVYKRDRKSTRLNSSHVKISYAVFC